MDYKVVDVPLKKIKTIHHLSDIHVRNLKRHTEYRQVFDKVYDRIKQNSKDSVIYVGGDIAHAKLDMSPELVDLISEFLQKLADIAPTIMILGGHFGVLGHPGEKLRLVLSPARERQNRGLGGLGQWYFS